MHKVYISVDNGASGSFSILDTENSIVVFDHIPITKAQNYTKKKQNISRIDHIKFESVLLPYKDRPDVLCLIERPMTNAMRVMATISGARAFESVLCITERLKLSVEIVDSKQWQSKMLPIGLKREELKKASQDIGIRMYPQFKDKIEKHKDADSLLMAEWARRIQL